MDTYKEYLKNAYQRVVQATLQDESLPVLGEMENKSFYHSRISQLFTDLYSAERQNKIRELMSEVQKLKLKLTDVKQIQVVTTAQKPCLKCKLREQKEFSKKISQIQPDLLKQNLNFALKQNETLSQQLKQANEYNLVEVKELFKSSQIAQRRLNSQLEEMSDQLEQTKKMYKQLKANYNRQVQGLKDARDQLLAEKERNSSLQIKLKEYEKQYQNNQGHKQSLSQEIRQLKQSKDLLEDKIRRLEDEKGLHKQKICAYEKQLKVLGDDKNFETIKLSNVQGDNEKDQDQIFGNLVSKLAMKQLEIKKILRQKIQIQQENQILQKQLIDYKLRTEKTIQQLKQNLNKTMIEYERQLRSFRQKDLQSSIFIKQQQVESKINQMNDLKQKLKKSQTDKSARQSQLLKLTHSNKILTQNYQQISQTFRQQKMIYEQKMESYDKKLLQYKKLEKQLTKRAQLKEELQNNILQQEFKSKIKFYESKLLQTEQKLSISEKSQEKLSRKIQLLQKQLNSKPLKERNQALIIKEHELMMKVRDLENVVAETKMVSNELVNKKQQRIKAMKKQLEGKQEQITQLRFKLENSTKTIKQLESSLRNTETKLRNQQQKLINIQQKNRVQMLQMMKNHQQKVQSLTQQFQRYHSSISKNKSSANQKSPLSNALKNLEKEYQQKINNLQHQWSQLKTKNLLLEQKNKNNQQIILQYKQKLQIITNQLRKFKESSLGSQNLLQQQKNKQVLLVKYYEQKISAFKSMFKEFKFQICCQFLQAVAVLKSDLAHMTKQVLQSTQSWKKFMMNGKFQVEERTIYFKNTIHKRYEQDSDKQKMSTISRLEKQKQQITINYQNKLKQKQMDLMTIAAQKQFTIQQIRQNQNNIARKYKQLENNFKKVQTKLQKSQAVEVQLKDIISKMENKVDQAEKISLIKEKEVYQLQKVIEQLNEKVRKSETFYRQQINDCKLKYREENERMYNRFQRQFNKIVNISSKKSKQKGSLASIMSNRGFQIPTKGPQQDKITKLKKEIQQQKKIVQQLENQKKY